MDAGHLISVVNNFGIESDDIEFVPVSQGYIHNSYFVQIKGEIAFVLQRINETVFTNPLRIQKNIDRAIDTLGDSEYSKIHFLKTKTGQTLYKGPEGYWRIMEYIPASVVHESLNDPGLAYQAGKVLGKFHNLTNNLNPEDFEIIIPGFNDLSFRMKEFETAMESADRDSKSKARTEIEYVETKWPVIKNVLDKKLPLRVCHNDSKLSNILFDRFGKALCLIDLDTIMPGYFYYDFGDAVRTIVNPVSENETDLSRVEFKLDFFEAFLRGLKDSEIQLTQDEISTLVLGCAYMPFLHGLRALTDYLNGNIYYKVNYPDQNLDRAKNLFHFTNIVEAKSTEIKKILNLFKK